MNFFFFFLYSVRLNNLDRNKRVMKLKKKLCSKYNQVSGVKTVKSVLKQWNCCLSVYSPPPKTIVLTLTNFNS